MPWKPTNAGPKNLRELYHWAWNNFTSSGLQLGDVGGEVPGHTHSHPTLTNRDAADSHPISAVTALQGHLDAKINEGYGGIKLDTPAGIADLAANWETLPADAVSVSTPVDVNQDFATNSISILEEGVWLISISGTLAHNEINAGRILGVRIFNATALTAVNETGVPTGRNTPGTAFAYTALVNITAGVAGDDFSVQVGGSGDSYTSVTVAQYSIVASRVSGFGGAADGGGGGQVNTVVGGTDITVDSSDPVNPVVNYTGSGGGGGTVLIETITNPGSGEFDFGTIAGTYNRLYIKGNIRSTKVAATDIIEVLFNADTTPANYQFQDLFGTGVSADAATGQSPRIGSVTGSTGEGASPVDFCIEGYADSELKSAKCFTTEYRGANNLRIHYVSVYHDTMTAAITRLRIRSEADTLTGTLRLYGET